MIRICDRCRKPLPVNCIVTDDAYYAFYHRECINVGFFLAYSAYATPSRYYEFYQLPDVLDLV